jgi:lysophospholipase L1-like esterase
MTGTDFSTRKKVLFSLIVLVALSFAVEAVVRVKYCVSQDNWSILVSPFGAVSKAAARQAHKQPVDFRYSQEKSYTIYNRYEQKNYSINITSQGFFYPSLLEAADTTTCRVFCIGGSSTYGGQSWEETWPGYLQGCLEKKFPGRKWEVINFGQSGVGLLTILAKIKTQVLDYKSDAFIYYGGYNDADKADCLATERLGRNLIKDLSPTTKVLPFLGELHNLLHVRWSYLYTYLFEKYMIFKYIRSSGYPDIEGYASLLEQLAQTCRSRGIELVMASQVLDMERYPDKFEQIDYDDKDAGEQFYRQYAMSDMADHAQWITFRQRTLLKQQKDFARSNSLQYIDVRDRFHGADTGGEAKFYDIVHLSSLGNRLLAGMICEKLDAGFAGTPAGVEQEGEVRN